MGVSKLLASFAIVLSLGSSISADPVALHRILWQSSRYFEPTHDDYNADAVDDLLTWFNDGQSHVRLISGANASVIRQYDQPPITAFNFRMSTLRDVDGDGRRELLLGSPTDVWAVKSSGGPGRVDQVPSLFKLQNLPYGQFLAGGERTAMIASDDTGKVLLVDAASGQIRARLTVPATGSSAGLLGTSALNLGDLTGDGIDDFATAGSVNHFPNPTGSVFILNGALTTSGSTFISVFDLTAKQRLAELQGIDLIGFGSASTAHNTTITLGDPNPGDGKAEFLLLSGGPWGNNGSGGIAAHVLTRADDGTFSTRTVAAYQQALDRSQFGEELANLGDITGDGVNDAAILQANYKVGGQLLGRILIVDGAGLLDGYQPGKDVLQIIDGEPNAPFYGSMQDLGDYDHDGRRDLGISVLYNGKDGIYGYAQHIYSVVPEPQALLMGIATLGCRRRHTRSRV